MNKMKVKTWLVVIASAGLLSACQGNQKQQNESEASVQEVTVAEIQDIPFAVAGNYFINNTVESIDNPKITTKAEFDKIFGSAAVMGDNGMPTEIDFTKQYVIAIVKPETDQATQLTPVSLKNNDKNEVVFSYKVEQGEKLTYKIKPFLIIIVDNAISGDIVLNEIV